MFRTVLWSRPRTSSILQRASFALWDKPEEDICEGGGDAGTGTAPGIKSGKFTKSCGIVDSSGKCVAPLIPIKEVCRFACSCLMKVGVSDAYAKQVSNVLAMAEFKGIYWNGITKLPMLINDIKCGAICPTACPTLEKEGCSTGVVCGANGLGPVICNFAMKIAIAKAKGSGISIVTANRSNYCGLMSFYTDQALQCGLIGFAFSNGSPCAVPPCAKKTALGCNPISFAAPAKNCDALVIDTSTTVVSIPMIDYYAKNKISLPSGWATSIGADPKAEKDAKAALDKGTIPFLGDKKFAFKGYGLSLMVETLCGILADALYGPYIRKHGTRDEEANLAQTFICINPECFPPNFQNRLSCLLSYIRKMESVKPNSCPVQVPGDREREKMKYHDQIGGVLLSEELIIELDSLAKSLGVAPISKSPCAGGAKEQPKSGGGGGAGGAGGGGKCQKIEASGAKIEVSGPKVKASGAKIDVSGPKVKASGAKIDVSGPKVDVSAPKVEVKVPDAKVNVKVDTKK